MIIQRKSKTKQTGRQDNETTTTNSLHSINKSLIQKKTIITKTTVTRDIPPTSFENHQKLVQIMKGNIQLLEWQLNFEKKKRSFEAIRSYSNLNEMTTLNSKIGKELQFQQFKISEDTIINVPNSIGMQLIEKIQQKIQLENEEQKEFLYSINSIADQMKDVETLSCFRLSEIVQRKVLSKINSSFNTIKQQNLKVKVGRNKTKNMKNSIKLFVMPLNQLFNMQKKQALEIIASCPRTIAQITNQDPRGKILLKLDRFVKEKVKRTMWNWRLLHTQNGQNLLNRAADHLVLFTNINKTSAFYRLFQSIKKDRYVVPLRFRNGLTLLSVILNNKINQERRECFLHMKFFFGNDSLQKLTKKFLDTQKQVLFRKCKEVFSMFMIMEKNIKKNTDRIFFAKVEKERILWTFRQMVENLKCNQRDVLGIWRNLTSESILQENTKYQINQEDRSYVLSPSRQKRTNFECLQSNKNSISFGLEEVQYDYHDS